MLFKILNRKKGCQLNNVHFKNNVERTAFCISSFYWDSKQIYSPSLSKVAQTAELQMFAGKNICFHQHFPNHRGFPFSSGQRQKRLCVIPGVMQLTARDARLIMWSACCLSHKQISSMHSDRLQSIAINTKVNIIRNM